MSDGESQPRHIVRRRPVSSGGDVIQASGARRRDEERTLCILHGFAHGIIHPGGDVQLFRDFERLLAHGLAQAERHPGRRIRDIFAKNQHSIGQLNVMEGRRTGRPRLQNIRPSP